MNGTVLRPSDLVDAIHSDLLQEAQDLHEAIGYGIGVINTVRYLGLVALERGRPRHRESQTRTLKAPESRHRGDPEGPPHPCCQLCSIVDRRPRVSWRLIRQMHFRRAASRSWAYPGVLYGRHFDTHNHVDDLCLRRPVASPSVELGGSTRNGGKMGEHSVMPQFRIRPTAHACLT